MLASSLVITAGIQQSHKTRPQVYLICSLGGSSGDLNWRHLLSLSNSSEASVFQSCHPVEAAVSRVHKSNLKLISIKCDRI